MFDFIISVPVDKVLVKTYKYGIFVEAINF